MPPFVMMYVASRSGQSVSYRKNISRERRRRADQIEPEKRKQGVNLGSSLSCRSLALMTFGLDVRYTWIECRVYTEYV